MHPVPIHIGISSIGSGIGQSIINSIRLSNLPVKTFGFGTNPLAYGLYECDESVPSRSYYDPDYIDFIIQKCVENKIVLYIPGHDDDAVICAQNVHRFERKGIQVIVAGEKLLRICRDKLLMSQELNKTANLFVRGFSKADFMVAFANKETALPVIAKPRNGFASIGIEIITSEEDFYKIKANHIIQELAIPHSHDIERAYYLSQLGQGINPQVSEISIHFVADKNGGLLGKMMARNKLKNGVPIEIIPFEDKTIWQEIDRLYPTLKKLGLRGPFNLQGRITDEGLKLFELNTRFTGITGLRAFMGFNEVEACIKHWLGMPTTQDSLVINHRRFGIRQIADKVIDFDKSAAVQKIYKQITKQPLKTKKAILLTGATGYLGRNLIKELLLKCDNDFEIQCLIRDKQKAVSFWGNKVKIFDYSDFEQGVFSLGNVDILLHAGFARPHHTPTEIAESVAFSSAILTKAFQNQTANIIFISSQAVYGQDAPIPWKESTDVRTNSIYGMAKYSVEQQVIGLKKLYPHVNATSIRLGALTGGAEGFINIDLLSKMVTNVLKGENLTVMGGNQQIERLDIRDAVSGLIALLKNTRVKWKPVYNLGSGKQYRLMEIAEKIKQGAAEKGYEVAIIQQNATNQPQFGLNINSFTKDFNWQPQFELKETIRSLFEYLKKDRQQLQ